ncbi:Nitrogen regulatory protein [bioreactor metagenome]|uniref:Nitrogen regulatory protein n=1 Tax=bioreactor metagenome TaxID=1076179 RepID=A0A645GC37_9ZZZZ
MSALSTYLQAEDILLGLQVADKRQLFQAIGRHVQRIGGLAAKDVASGLTQRELAGSTGLGLGVAVPHARVKGLKHIRALYVRPAAGLAFGAPDAQPVADILVLLVPSPATQLHLELLAHVVSLLSDRAFRAALHARQSPVEIKMLLDERQL